MIVQSLYAQTGWPRKLLIDKDTIIGFTPIQLRIANYVRADKIFYRNLSDSLSKGIKKLTFINDKQNQLINEYKSDSLVKEVMITNLDKINKNFIELDKKNQRQIKWLKLQRNTLAITCIATLTKIFVFK